MAEDPRATVGIILGALGAVAVLVAVAPSTAALAGGPDVFGYAYKDGFSSGGPAFNYVDISLNGTIPTGFPCDDCVSSVPIGFPFVFYAGADVGQYGRVNISSNGFLSFNANPPNGCCSGQAMPTAGGPNNLIAGYWEDLNPSLGGSVRYRTVGAAPDRVFITQFTNVPHHPGGNLTNFQFKLFEGTNNIEVHYKSLLSDGGTHSSGIENVTGLDGLTYRFGSWTLTNTAVRYSFLKPDTDALLSGTAGDLGWWRSSVSISLTCQPPEGATCSSSRYRVDGEDPTIYSVYGLPFSVVPDGDHHLDAYSISSYGTVENPERLTFRIDKTKPVVSAGAVCSVALVNGYCPGTMLVTTTASDATSGLRLGEPQCTLDGNAAACGALSVSTSGAHTVVISAQDRAGNTATASVSFTVDNQGPLLSLSPSCSVPGSNGWCRGSVQVTTSATDAVSGISGSPACKRDGAAIACGTISVTGDGSHTVEISAADKAGNTASRLLKVLIDATKPTAQLSTVCSAPGNAGWCRGTATLVATTGDATSGIGFEECTVDDVPVACDSGITEEGQHAAALVVRDGAGNEATAAIAVRVDATPPQAQAKTQCALAGSAGWCRAPTYTYEGKATDLGSGVASVTCRLDGVAAPCQGTVSTQGAHAIEVTAKDVAGNVAVETKALGIDSVAPTVQVGIQCTVPGNNGWCRGPALVQAQAQDASSGIADVDCTLDAQPIACGATLSDDGTFVLRATARDVAGNSASAQTEVRIDATAPAAQAFAACADPGEQDWCRADWATAGGAASDATSGIVSAACTADGASISCTGSVVRAAGLHTVRIVAQDAAGNSAAHDLAFGLDFTAPTGTIASPLLLPGSGAVTWTAADGGSGLALVEVQQRSLLLGGPWVTVCSVAATGSSSAGSCAVNPPLDLACFRLVVRDVAGHERILDHRDTLGIGSTPVRLNPTCGVSL